MIIVDDIKYKYKSVFDSKTGRGLRTGVLDENGADTGRDPYMGSFPELLDVGIMGHCAHGLSGLCLTSGVQCYQSGNTLTQSNMPFESFKRIIDECSGRTFQVALGGRGDPDMHEDFEKIISYAREHDVVPNFTTSGFGLEEHHIQPIKEYCGAVAVSWYRNSYTKRAIEMFLDAGIKTNIHYCISAATIDEAIDMMENKSYPSGINRMIFLLHKPVGLGTWDNVLATKDGRVKRFFSLFDSKEHADKAGFDSCSVPALLQYTKNIHPYCIEPCEAGRFSAYISPDMKLWPCSFEKNGQYGISIKDESIERAWNSGAFEAFRGRQKGKCSGCGMYENCFAGCPIVPGITLCDRPERSFKEENL